MTDLNKTKLHVILAVTFTFTFITAMKDNHWVGYVLTLFIFPLITWGFLELMIKFKKDTTGDIKTIVRKGKPLYVKEIRLGDLDKTKCSKKFLSHNLHDETIVNVKCHLDGTLDLRGKSGEYRIILEDKL
jgi:hypothetical protein